MEILACRRPVLLSILKKRKLIKRLNTYSHTQQRSLSNIMLRRMDRNPIFKINNPQLSRNFSMMRILNSILKLRYLVIGSAVGGGVSVSKKYQEWKDSLPDLSWLDDIFANNNTANTIQTSLKSIMDTMQDFDFDSSKSNEKLGNLKVWLDSSIDQLFKATEITESDDQSKIVEDISPIITKAATTDSKDYKQKLEMSQQELIEVQLKYQKELEKLEKENKELRKILLLAKNHKMNLRKVKKSLIDMYSELLDELNDYDSNYQTQDHLPRVIVIGDQSSGKTSVLEMIAQARIFPRGAGEMMTRAPVKVTLSEGPYHVAKFKDSAKEFDLTKESELAELRKEVEVRMKKTVSRGNSVSNEVISMTVRGPGLQRMVLVDLPGIISSVTQGMAPDTRECIRQMTTAHMSNPNAIILCVQDGSVDAERSNVTDLVSQIDPQGRRTILVLTKVDLAEKNMANADRVNKILSGSLFPMKALGYFAVITGKGSQNDSIDSIKEYEEKFFRNSKLFRDSIGISSQLTTRNLSIAVSDCFWKMVRETVEQQADSFKATRYNLETEWKNNFPRYLELDRDDLFEKARGEVLNEVVNLSLVSVKDWEEKLNAELWNSISHYIIENVYLPAGYSVNQTNSTASFNTVVDIKLKQFAEEQLPRKSINIGWIVLKDMFKTMFEKNQNQKLQASDEILENLKTAVIDEALTRHSWEDKALEMLRVIQLNTLEDRCIKDKYNWDQAAQFLTSTLEHNLKVTDDLLKEMTGPSNYEKWFYWQSCTAEQTKRSNIKYELENLLHSDPNHSNLLSKDEQITISNNLKQKTGTPYELDEIWQTWYLVYRRHYFKTALENAHNIKKQFYHYQETNELQNEYYDIEMFWRIIRMIKVTANVLRQQITNRELRRLHKELKEVLDEYSQNNEIKCKLLTGRRVTLVEELNKVKQIQEKLEDFIEALNKEK
ncbi:dynamin-like 120 kDa protein, mitochondrial isoform X2 [Aphis gossypii]|nr:dynamin-like 120 kDa protein, mitochondrial isoform X2 [Aphis gossypii]XP_050060306.1 dynamin-like 120 kDa protein, mitochondrial isoform X2 [Aphis gossypii]XP_050060307.1 dynamin-like 120 kDa protein, mitochondrial isoform X2 [Aphis gossypii]XP_050060308.1 dynamin-like 120 kDa protein, mitochondrial isoform X2 [Aphis gossypii]